MILALDEGTQRIDQAAVVRGGGHEPADQLRRVEHIAVLEEERLAPYCGARPVQRDDAVGRAIVFVEQDLTTGADVLDDPAGLEPGDHGDITDPRLGQGVQLMVEKGPPANRQQALRDLFRQGTEPGTRASG